MQAQNNQVEAKVILEIPNVQMHRLTGNQRLPFSSGIAGFYLGTIRVGELEKQPSHKIYFINLNSFYYTINKETIFIKVVYDNIITYIYPHFDVGFTSITINKSNAANIARLEETFAYCIYLYRNTAGLIEYAQALENPILKQKITTHCPNLNKNPLVGGDKIEEVIKKTGEYANIGFKWLGGVMNTGVTKLGEYLGEKIETKNQIKVSQQTKTKWNQIKEGTGKFFKVSTQLIGTVLEPVIEKGKQYSHSINEKIDKSDNKNVKYMKQLGSTASDALVTAFNGFVVAATEVGTNIGKTTVNLWQKKYGDDVPKTLFEGEKKQDPQQKPLIELHDHIKQEVELPLLNKNKEEQKGELYPKLPDEN